MQRLQQQYNKEILPVLSKEFGYKNPMQVPKITKIMVNVGFGKFRKDAKFVEAIAQDLKKITGQQPVKKHARKSIAGFKVRENEAISYVVTLRGERMYGFLDRLINVALPRVRDFRGVNPNGFDRRGNYHLGLKEHLVFPEIHSDALEHTFGLQVSIVTNGGRDEVTKKLLTLFKFPFKTNDND
jgi:large subunit ribosomal protein L5